MNSEVASKYFKNLAPAPAPPPPPIRITSFEEDMKHQSETGWQGEPVEVYQADKEEEPKKGGFHAYARKRSASDLGTSSSSTASNGREDYTATGTTTTTTTPTTATITITKTEATTTTTTQHNNSTLGFLGKATAVFDFIAENYGEINFVAGDILCVYGKYDDWWYGYVEGKGGPHGYFPAVYVEEQ